MTSYTYDQALKTRVKLLEINPIEMPTAEFWAKLRARQLLQEAEISKVKGRAETVGAMSVFLALIAGAMILTTSTDFGSVPKICGALAFLFFLWFVLLSFTSKYHDLSAFHTSDFEPITEQDYVEVLKVTSNNRVALDYVQGVLAQNRELIFAELVGLRHLRNQADNEHRQFVGELARSLLTTDSPVSTAAVSGQIEAVNFYRENPIYAFVDLKKRQAAGQSEASNG